MNISYAKVSSCRLDVEGVKGLTVAIVITNAALFEHMLISVSRAMIFFTRDTAVISICHQG